jgi:hypothetical protein
MSSYIGIAANALGLALTFNQYEEELSGVTDEIERVTGLLNDVGALCNKYGLTEEYLPNDLREMLEKIRRSVYDTFI